MVRRGVPSLTPSKDSYQRKSLRATGMGLFIEKGSVKAKFQPVKTLTMVADLLLLLLFGVLCRNQGDYNTHAGVIMIII